MLLMWVQANAVTVPPKPDHGYFHRATTCILVLKILFCAQAFLLGRFFCAVRPAQDALAWVEFAETSLYFEVILSVRGSAMETLLGSLRRMTDCRIAMVTSVVLDRSVHFT